MLNFFGLVEQLRNFEPLAHLIIQWKHNKWIILSKVLLKRACQNHYYESNYTLALIIPK